MTVTLRDGDFAYESLEYWETFPEGVSPVECPGIAVDDKDDVFVLTRNVEYPIMVFAPDGTFKRSFGAGVFSDFAHGISIAPDGMIFCADVGNHAIRKFSPDGELLLTIGTPDQPAEIWSGEPFCRPTHVAVSPNSGDVFITDGYGNSRVHKYSADGERILSWGEPGIDPGQFVMPHNILIDADERIYVADRECLRVQIFDTDGQFITMWNNIYRPDGMTIGPDGLLYIAELNTQGIEVPPPGVGHRISIWSLDGKQLARLGDPDMGEEAGKFIAPHGIAVDSKLDLYIGEVTYSVPEVGGRHQDPPREFKSLKKLKRLGASGEAK